MAGKRRKPGSKALSAVAAQHRRFVDAYLETMNASEAARRAGYSPRTAASQGSDLLTRPDIREMVEKRLDEAAMPAREVLARLSEHARIDMADLVDKRGCLDLSNLADRSRSRKVKKVRVGKDGDVAVEVYDAQAALVKLAEYHGLLKRGVEVTGPNGGPIQVQAMAEAVKGEAERLATAEGRIAALLAARQGTDPSVAAQHESARDSHGGNGNGGNGGGNGNGGNGRH